MAVVIFCKVWSSFKVLTLVVVVQGSPTTDLLESMDCLLRDCKRYFPNADRKMTENLIVRLEVIHTYKDSAFTAVKRDGEF